eukprot:m.460592 g.460592  ORF g.460592 m.460592 type:complete len:68 (-) comp22072_c0_seq1:25-228(-)
MTLFHQAVSMTEYTMFPSYVENMLPVAIAWNRTMRSSNARIILIAVKATRLFFIRIQVVRSIASNDS